MTALPRGQAAVLVRTAAVAAVIALAGVLTACSTSSGPAGSPTPVLLGSGSTGSPEPSATAPSGPIAVDLPLASAWAVAADGAAPGYRLDLDETSRPGVFDGRFYYRAADGSVRGQRVVTITVTGTDEVLVRWPDGRSTPGRLTLSDGGSARTELALDPGCLDYLVDGSSQVDCRLYPVDEFGPSASAQPSPTGSGSASAAPGSSASTPPVALPDADEALGYLCSVSNPAMIDHVTGPDADPYATAVLQGALAAAGFDPGSVDGTYRAPTRRAVRAFQQAAGLAVDGLVGPRTWTALQARVCTLPSDPAEQ